jgi:hypothetical protein
VFPSHRFLRDSDEALLLPGGLPGSLLPLFRLLLFRLLLFRLLLFQPGIHPIVDCPVPELAILRLQYPVSFIGKVKHFGWYFQSLQGGEQLKAFRDIQSVIELSMDYQRGRFEVYSFK